MIPEIGRLRALMRPQAFAVPIALVATVIAHGINMFQYPYYENDEAVYLSQGWSVLHGRLAPYTYWYDHAPAGWFQLAGWLRLTGLYAFGTSVNGGRVAMLLLHVAAVALVFAIVRRLTGSVGAAFLAAMVLAVSPLGTYYMRRVLLDNIMLVWVLLSVHLLLGSSRRLWMIVGSAAAFAVAMLTKETAVVFAPVLILMVYALGERWQRRFAVVLWVAAAALIVSLYPLMAVLKGELLPAAATGGAPVPHVSLLSALLWQASRPGNGILDVQRSLFWHAFARWWLLDPFLIVAGTIAVVGNLLLARSRVGSRWSGLLALSLILYLLRGGLVIDFYVSPLIPLLAMNLAVFVHEAATLVSRRPNRRPRLRVITLQRTVPALSGSVMITVALIGAAAGGYGWGQSQNINARWLYVADQTGIQREALSRLQALPPGTVIAMDNYGYLDLHAPAGTASHPNAHWYWKLDRDPELKLGLLHADPGTIDYILVTPQVSMDLNAGASPMVSAALEDSKVVDRWQHDGYGVELWESRTPSHILRYAWQSYVRHFITSAGRVYDPQKAGVTTSEAQAYAMLRAVWMDDRQTFDRVWNWTRSNLQTREDSLLAWRYGKLGPGSWGVLDRNSAADADEDAALALLFAARAWNAPQYHQSGVQMVKDIWNTEVSSAAGIPYLVAGSWAIGPRQLVLNPSYEAPYAYRVFAQVDRGHPWMALVDSAYQLLEEDSAAPWNTVAPKFLATEWVAVDRRSGRLVEPDPITGGGSRWFSFGAARVAWRAGLDYQWNKDPRAAKLLGQMQFILSEFQGTGHFFATYRHDGQPIETYESRAVIGAVLPALSVMSPQTADEVYRAKLYEGFYKNGDDYYWTDPNNYYDQNWAWFGTAQYAGLLTNYWPSSSHMAGRH